jgi:hypothetical protein
MFLGRQRRIEPHQEVCLTSQWTFQVLRNQKFLHTKFCRRLQHYKRQDKFEGSRGYIDLQLEFLSHNFTTVHHHPQQHQASKIPNIYYNLQRRYLVKPPKPSIHLPQTRQATCPPALPPALLARPRAATLRQPVAQSAQRDTAGTMSVRIAIARSVR